MAPDVATVDQFLVDLAEHARTPALKEIDELKAIAQQDGIDELKPWDSTYYSEKLKVQQFNFLKKI
jgi:oligopeptidase A